MAHKANVPECTLHCWEVAAGAGDSRAAFRLAAALYDAGLVRDAALWYQKSAEAGNGDALYALGCCHELGLMHCMVDVEKAGDYYWRAMRAGSRNAEVAMASLHLDQVHAANPLLPNLCFEKPRVMWPIK